MNSKGEFNVSRGKYANLRICDAENLRACSNTLFYFDPPYKPITETSSFTSYAKEGFNDAEQIRLRDFCDRISKDKALFVASN